MQNVERGIVFKKGLNWFTLVFLNMTYEGERWIITYMMSDLGRVIVI